MGDPRHKTAVKKTHAILKKQQSDFSLNFFSILSWRDEPRELLANLIYPDSNLKFPEEMKGVKSEHAPVSGKTFHSKHTDFGIEQRPLSMRNVG